MRAEAPLLLACVLVAGLAQPAAARWSDCKHQLVDSVNDTSRGAQPANGADDTSRLDLVAVNMRTDYRSVTIAFTVKRAVAPGRTSSEGIVEAWFPGNKGAFLLQAKLSPGAARAHVGYRRASLPEGLPVDEDIPFDGIGAASLRVDVRGSRLFVAASRTVFDNYGGLPRSISFTPRTRRGFEELGGLVVRKAWVDRTDEPGTYARDSRTACLS